ncbi:hypothetical protein FRACYDRAFT_266749 [Fragilariopsis cylindrus CCMP1102]|uniref:HTTM-like domain-containing protein n=1 Tax=Fragilariopsis cylindrus CCMP1102 TaxID=635003 RepID=A0A1E7EIZ8_9STRA|nr:hypothetical protein FRACYDRAFT_266749 [Fragilariopsis cylindrus CCMP1102]|eukprot:OEU05865.1 hypothetical protein FRACYDRAFT_266749 [Fragilariopsis cylindrus CCMP1102]
MTASQCPNVWNRFFHSRVGATGIWISGWMRIGFAFLYLADRILWSLDVAEFLAPQTGLLPYIQQQQQQQQNIHKTLEWNLFGLAPTHQGWFYGLFYIGILQSVLLLLGIAPRFQLVCLHLNTVSWTHHNYLCFDYQDDMMRMWGFWLLFLPSHQITLWDRWGYKKTYIDNNDSYPIWPFRLWQLQITFVYLQSGLCKLEGSQWRDGTALFTIGQNHDFNGGVLQHYFLSLFRWNLPLKCLAWFSLLVELLCPWFIWPSFSRVYTLIAVTLLHLGIELTMNMHTFEWNSILGWMVFLVVPHRHKNSNITAVSTAATSEHTSVDHSLTQKQPLLSRATVSRAGINFWIVILTLCAFVQCPMLETLHRLFVDEGFAPWLDPMVGSMVQGNHWILTQLEPVIDGLGIRQGSWQMYCPGCHNTNYRYEAIVQYHSVPKEGGAGNDASGTTTTVAWSSPEWTNMTWYERKRWQRPMDLYTNLFYDDQDSAWINICLRAADEKERQLAVEVSSIELQVLSDEEYKFPPDAVGWFDDVHPLPKQSQPMWKQVLRKKLYQLSCRRRRRRRKSEDTTIATTVWKNEKLFATRGNHGTCLEWEAVCHACTNIETGEDTYDDEYYDDYSNDDYSNGWEYSDEL